MKSLLTKTVLAVSGSSSLDFLQGQLSNDLTKCTDKTIQINCYLQHQGKIIAILWLVKNRDTFYLIVENELLDLVFNRLNMFKLRSDCVINKTELYVIGVLGTAGQYSLNKNQSIDLMSKNHYKKSNEWEICCIDNLLAEVYASTSLQFTPQLLNLDINEYGLSFTKGCYVGQEVVARMHYIGKARRKTFKFNSNNKVCIGDKLTVKESTSLKSSGVVVRVAKKDNHYIFLATLEVKFTAHDIFINNKKINILNA